MEGLILDREVEREGEAYVEMWRRKGMKGKLGRKEISYVGRGAHEDFTLSRLDDCASDGRG